MGLGSFWACSNGNVVNSGVAFVDAGPDGNVPDGYTHFEDGAVAPSKAVGETCTGSGECRTGLECTDGKCAFGHAGAADSPCVAAGECQTGLQCFTGVCTAPAADAGAEGAACKLDVDCQGGLRCGIVGFAAQCIPEGTADVGQSCSISGDCYAGLICVPAPPAADAGADAAAGAPVCTPIPPRGGSSFGIPVPPSITCEEPSQGKVQAYFEVPGATGTTAGGDFFRLPFPNDARITNGKIDLTGFPTPGSALLGFDPVQIYLDAIVANESAWGAYPTVLFRFSGPVDFKTFEATSTDSPVWFLDITDPTAPGNGGASWGYSSARGKYICDNWFGVRRPQGSPLEPGHTYAAYLTTAGRDMNGLAIERSTQFTAMLASSPPSDQKLLDAYASYKPFRDYLTSQAISPSTILNASVITVANVQAPMASLAAAANAAPAPTAASWVKCGSGTASPCPQADNERACGAASADYDEYHAMVSIPIFQKGTAPYLTSGGGIDSSGPVRTEEVCMAVTVPKGTAPATGWPLVVFAHGTGGSFRDHIRAEVAGALAKATTPMAVLGYDQVEHGPRRGSSTASPNVLFFNFANPDAARGNPMQGAADVISMGRFAKTMVIPASVAGTDVTVDPNTLVFFGHSQGSMHGSLGLPYTNDYVATVLSGNGASLMDALVSKTKPVNIAAAVPFALGGDFGDKLSLFGGVAHPVLTILQQWIDPADPLNFGKAIARSPVTGVNPKSVFQTYGLDDTYSPPVTMATYALAAQLQVAKHDATVTTADSIGDLAEQDVPLTGNYQPATGPALTLAVREYASSSGDGHFVAFDVPSANQDVVRFLTMAGSGQVPTVGK